MRFCLGSCPSRGGRAAAGRACPLLVRCRRAGARLPTPRLVPRAKHRPVACRSVLLPSVTVPLGLRAKGTLSVAGLRPSLCGRAPVWLGLSLCAKAGRLQAPPRREVRLGQEGRPLLLWSTGLRPFSLALAVTGLRPSLLLVLGRAPAWRRLSLLAVRFGRLQARLPSVGRRGRGRLPRPRCGAGLRPFAPARWRGPGTPSTGLASTWMSRMFLRSDGVIRLCLACGAIFVVCRFSERFAERTYA